MKRKFISYILAVSCVVTAFPKLSEASVNSGVILYDFISFSEEDIKWSVAEGFEGKTSVSVEEDAGEKFLRMHTESASGSNENSPYIYMPVNGGEGIEYKEGKKIAVEIKLRTDTQVDNWVPDARLQLKYNLPDNLTELNALTNTDSDGYTRKYRTAYNDCNLWGCEGGVFRAPNGYVVTGDIRQTSMLTLDVAFCANNWYVITVFIDGINNSLDYEIKDCKTGEKYTIEGRKPYFSLGETLKSISLANFKGPVNNADFDYVKIYECDSEYVEKPEMTYDFERAWGDGIEISDESKFRFIQGAGVDNSFGVLTQNGAYSIPAEVVSGKSYIISLKYRSGSDLAVTADGEKITTEITDDGEWKKASGIYAAKTSGRVLLSSELSSDEEYYVDDFKIEEITVEDIFIDSPEKIARGKDASYSVSFKTNTGDLIPAEEFEFETQLSSGSKSAAAGGVIHVAEDENIGNIYLKVINKSLGFETSKEIEIYDEIETEISYEDIDGNPLEYGITDNSVKCNVKVLNNADSERCVTVAAAVYEDDIISKVLTFEEILLNAGENKNITFGPYENFSGAQRLKVFIWKEMMPTALARENSKIINSLYIAENGSDENDGSLESPLKTLEAARDMIRTMEIPEGGITVYVRGGTYYRDKVFSLTNSDSGTVGSPVTYKAYPGETPVFTQGVELDLSKSEKVTENEILEKLPDDNAREHLYSINLADFGITSLEKADHVGAYTGSLNTWVKKLKDTDGAATFESSPTTPTNEVFFDGKPLTVARYPNGDNWISITNPEDIINVGAIPRFWEDNMVGKANYIEEEDRNINDFFTIRLSERVDRWVDAKDALMFGFWYHNWATQTVGIGSVDAENNTITSDRPSYFGVRAGSDDFAKYYVYNLIEELDTEGEYYFDRDNLKLYFYRSDKMTDDKKLSVSNGNYYFINMDNASHIVIDGLEFTVGRGRGINISANNITVKNCTVKNLPNRAISAVGNNNLIYNCEISNVNGGITLSSNGSYKNNFEYGNSKIEKCRITDFSRRTRVYTTAIDLGGTGNAAINNEMSGSYHMAASISGYDNLFQGNEIYDVCKYANDAAAVYMGRTWVRHGNRIIGNYIHDIHSDPIWAKSIGVNAVFADDLFGGITISGNIFENIDGYAVKFNGGYDNIVENNIFINCKRRGMIPGGTVTIGRYSGGMETTDDYILAGSCVDQLDGLISSGYLNSSWSEDEHAIAEVKNLPWGDDPDYYKDVDITPIENFILFMKSDEWKENEEENIKKYINDNWHKKYPQIYNYIVNHAGDTYNNVYRNNILIDADDARTSNMTEERFKDSGNIHYDSSILSSGEYRTVDYSLLSDAQKKLQVSSEYMGTNGVEADNENPKGVIVDDDCSTAEGFESYSDEYTTITTGVEGDVTYVRMNGAKASANNNYHAGMLYDLYDENILYKADEKIVIDMRLRYKTTSADGSSVPYMLLKLNMPVSTNYVGSYKVLSQATTDGKYPDTDENGSIIMEERGYNNQLYDSTLVGFLNEKYAYTNGYANGNTAKCANVSWKQNTSVGLTSLDQFTEWIRVVTTIDKAAGTANYKFYSQNGMCFANADGTLANMSTDIYFNNVGFGIINAARGDVTIDVDYLKISIE